MCANPVAAGILPNATRIWRQRLSAASCPGGTSENNPRFRTLGRRHQHRFSPEGTADLCASSVVPSGLMAFLHRVPKAEALGYCQKSLRDENEILVGLGLWHAACQCRESNFELKSYVP